MSQFRAIHRLRESLLNVSPFTLLIMNPHQLAEFSILLVKDRFHPTLTALQFQQKHVWAMLPWPCTIARQISWGLLSAVADNLGSQSHLHPHRRQASYLACACISVLLSSSSLCAFHNKNVHQLTQFAILITRMHKTGHNKYPVMKETLIHLYPSHILFCFPELGWWNNQL